MSFLHELLDVLGCGTARSGFEQSTSREQGNDGKHFRAGAEFEDGEQIGEVVPQHVSGCGNGIEPILASLAGHLGGLNRSENADVQPLGLQGSQLCLHVSDQVGVMGPVFVEPKDYRTSTQAGTVHGEFDPVHDRHAFGLAHPPEVTGLDLVTEQGFARIADHPDRARAGNLKGLVVRTVFLRLLRHQAGVGDVAHGGYVKGSVGFAEIDGRLIDPGIIAVGNDRFGVGGISVGAPHLTGRPDHRGHRGVDDDAAGNVEVGDAFVRVDHGQRRAIP